jgi:spermidine synthase
VYRWLLSDFGFAHPRGPQRPKNLLPVSAVKEFSAKSVLYSCETEFQSILVIKSAQYGKVLVLDGVIQMTERDEFAFHEMLVHMPLCSHPHPKKVLIIGGGDGAALFQVCLHSGVEQVTVVEIDPKVVEVVKENFPVLAAAFQDPRVTIIHRDGAEYLKSTNETFDVILGDTLDPVGPAESLFQPEFYERMEEVLNDFGMICVQAECFWMQLELISDLYACCHDIFDYVSYASTQVPTFPCGQIGFLVAGKGGARRKLAASNPIRECAFETKWYSPDMHRAAFVLPPFVMEALEEKSPSEKEPECFLTQPGCAIL